MGKRIVGIFITFVTCAAILSGCADHTNGIGESRNAAAKEYNLNFKLEEDRSVYAQDNEGSVVDMYVTVLRSSINANKPSYTLADLNKYQFNFYSNNQTKPVVRVFFQEGTPKGSKQAVTANATMEPRGHSVSEAKQKSFKITLFKGTALWRGQRIINLNKHHYT